MEVAQETHQKLIRHYVNRLQRNPDIRSRAVAASLANSSGPVASCHWCHQVMDSAWRLEIGGKTCCRACYWLHLLSFDFNRLRFGDRPAVGLSLTTMAELDLHIHVQEREFVECTGNAKVQPAAITKENEDLRHTLRSHFVRRVTTHFPHRGFGGRCATCAKMLNTERNEGKPVDSRLCIPCAWMAMARFNFQTERFSDLFDNLDDAFFASLKKHARALEAGEAPRAYTEPEEVSEDFHLDTPVI